MDEDILSSTPGATIRLLEDERGTRLVLGGTIGVAEAGELHRAALAATSRPGIVAIDWSAVERIDTATAQLLIALATALRNDGRRLELPPPPSHVDAFLHRTALHDLLFS